MADIKVYFACKNCKNEFIGTKWNMCSMAPLLNDKKLILKYFACPNCSEAHFVQIDDEETERQEKFLRMTLIKILARKKKKQGVKRYKERFRVAKEELKNNRSKLNEEFSGKIFEYGGKVYNLTLSSYKVE